jgi:hypothetical protein
VHSPPNEGSGTHRCATSRTGNIKALLLPKQHRHYWRLLLGLQGKGG